MAKKQDVSASYRAAGVDTQAGQDLVRRIAPLAAATARAGAEPSLGGFGGLFDLAAAGWKDPMLVAASDGAGTKLSLAIQAGRPETAGRDLVAMSVNDLVVQGAEPLFFLDYIAADKLEIAIAEKLVAGIADACRESGCALIGGETAEMPGTYKQGEHDLAGFAVGAVERGQILPRSTIQAGDVVLGLESDGLHSNGFSLVRKIIKTRSLALDAPYPPAPKQTIADALLVPTRLYVKPLLALLRSEAGAQVKGLAHITGGGWAENIPRAWGRRDDLAAELNLNALPLPPLFQWLGEQGKLDQQEMRLVFNCGLGMALVVAKESAQAIASQLEKAGERVVQLGQLISRTPDSPTLVYRND